jgi:molybdopterin/thiamine biosynthesis adenylyltransferase
VNDACVLAKKPYSHAGMLRFEGQTFTYVPGHRCYRCLFRAPPPPGSVPNCADAGILGMLPGTLGSIQATEAVKWILFDPEISAGTSTGLQGIEGLSMPSTRSFGFSIKATF